jgi:SAM-dependent methyltransferase
MRPMNQLIKNAGKSALKLAARSTAWLDGSFLTKDVPLSTQVSHQNWRGYLQKAGNHAGMRILEIGSREVTGASTARRSFANAQYVGFDFYPGANVDVVGDAHKLSSYFANDAPFDIIYSSACFEHFAMPWIVAVEIAKLLKIGGTVFVETHFSFGSHERPWNFFQFSDMGLRVLFSPALGFECIEAGMSSPMVGRFSSRAAPYLRFQPIRGLYCHSEYLGRKVREVKDLRWESLDIAQLVPDTKYPAPRSN